jgi:diguanylate cyclase (GGDEF)-like protein/PAS domain S-box-containing protein
MAIVVDERYYKAVAGMLDALPERVSRYRLSDLTVTYCNVAWAAGHNLDPTQVIGRSLLELLSPAEKVGLELQLRRLGPDNPLLVDEIARPAPDAPGRWVEWVDQYLPGPDGAEVLSVGRDVTERHMAELKVAASEAGFRDLADNSADVVWRFLVDPYPHFDYVSPSVENILGYPPSMFLGELTPFLAILDDEGRALIAAALQGKPMPERHDFRYRTATDSIVIGEKRTTSISGGQQGVSRDVTERRKLQADLADLALRDPLTGLANRRLLDELLEAGLAHARRDDLALAVAYIDLDGFKEVNDTYGHDAGDAVLCEIARRLLASVRTADLVARVGGDEFVIVYEPNQSGSEDLTVRINEALAVPISVGATVTVFCQASVGYADTRTAGLDAAGLLAAADAALSDKKRARRA